MDLKMEIVFVYEERYAKECARAMFCVILAF